MIVALASGINIVGIFLYYRGNVANLEKLYLIVALTLVTCFVLIYPGVPYGGDSAIHLSRSLTMSQTYDENQWQYYGNLVNNEGKVLVDDIKKLEEITDSQVIHSYKQINWHIMQNSRWVAYIPFATGLVISDALNLQPHAAFRFAEICNGWFICLIMYCAIKRLKSRKLVLAMYAMLPYTMYVTTRFSYTPWVIAWITYGSAYVIGLLQDNKLIKKKDLFAVYGAFLLGCLPKQPYFFIALIPLLLLPKDKLFDNCKINIILAAGFIAILVFSLMSPVIFGDKGFGFYTDSRGGTEVDSVGQLRFILAHPFLYTKILLRHIYKILSAENFIYGVNGFTSFGLPMSTSVGRTVLFKEVISVSFLLIVLFDKGSDLKEWANLKNKMVMFFLTFIGMSMISTVMYICYTPVGHREINGVNPLYQMTFMFPAFCMLTTEKIKLCVNWRKFNSLFMLVLTAVMYLSLCFRIIAVYQF